MSNNAWDAVIFDYGQVLSCGPTSEDLRHFTTITGVADSVAFCELYARTRADYDAGLQDCRLHWQTFSEAANVNLTAEQVERLAVLETRMWLRTNPSTLALAREAQSNGLQAAILSNMPRDLLDELRRELEWLPEFKVQIWSCELGIVKPNPKIYRACLDALGCEPHRALFFDDRAGNVEAARLLGIDAHRFSSADVAGTIVHSGLFRDGSPSSARLV